MKKPIAIMAAILLMVWIGGCGDDGGTDVGDHTWNVSYSVANESSEAIAVELAGPLVYGINADVTEVAAGETELLVEYGEFLGPPPDAGRDFWCLTVRRLSDSVAVRQLCPVSNDHWERRDPRRFEAEFTLIVGPDVLEPATNVCPRLEGTVVDAETSEPIVGASVVVFDGDDGDHVDVRTDENGAYWMYLPAGTPESELSFFKDGYQARTVAIPAELEELDDRRYRFDVELTRQ